MTDLDRRAFLLIASSSTAAIAFGATGMAVRLGGPIFLKAEDPAELAREHRRLGYSAAYCPAVKIEDTVRLRAIEQAFKSENVVIAEVGAWVNMLDPDSGKRHKNLAYVTERCAIAEAVGARCCVDIAGSYNPDVWYGPNPKNLSKDFFESTVENCRRVIDDIKPKRTKFTIEMMPWSLPDGPDNYLRLIRAVDRPAFGVHLDICNVINSPARFYGNGSFISECFRTLGPWIASCHAKDLAWDTEYNIHFRETVPGRGQINYAAYLTELGKLKTDAPLMLEHLKTAEEYDEGKRYIQRIASENGVAFT